MGDFSPILLGDVSWTPFRNLCGRFGVERIFQVDTVRRTMPGDAQAQNEFVERKLSCQIEWMDRGRADEAQPSS